MVARIRALCAFKEHAQDGRGIKRPAERTSVFHSSQVARSRALCAFKEHAQDGRGIKRPAERASVFHSSQAARSRALCAFESGGAVALTCTRYLVRRAVVPAKEVIVHAHTPLLVSARRP